MEAQAGTAGLNGLVEATGAPVLLREGGEDNRRRVRLDPAPQIVETGGLGHGDHDCTVTDLVTALFAPPLSVTVRTTT